MAPHQIPSGTALFAGLGSAELAAFEASMVRRTFGKGVFIYHKDSPGRVLYVIQSGLVRLFILSDMGQEISMDVLGPGDAFGAWAVLDGLPRATGAVALETTLTLTWDRADLLPALEACPQLARNLLALLTNRLRYTSRYLEDLVFLDVQGRVAARLLDLARRGSARRETIEIELSLTQSELATWVAASRESVNKVLSTLRAKGLIAVDGQKITILEPRGLEQEIVH